MSAAERLYPLRDPRPVIAFGEELTPEDEVGVLDTLKHAALDLGDQWAGRHLTHILDGSLEADEVMACWALESLLHEVDRDIARAARYMLHDVWVMP